MQTYGFPAKKKAYLFNNNASCLLNIVYLLTDIR